MKRFNKEVLEVDKANDKVQLTTFKTGLKSKEFVMALAKNPLELMTKLPFIAQKYVNAEYAQDIPKGQKRERKDHSSSHDRIKQRDSKARRMVNFTPLVMLVDKILM